MRTARGRDIRRCAAIVCFSSRETHRSRQRMTSVTKSLQDQPPIPAHLAVCADGTPHQNRGDGERIGTEPKTEKPTRAIHLTSATEESLSRSSSGRRRNDSRQATSVTAKATVLRVGSTRLDAHTGSPPARTSASSRDVTPGLLERVADVCGKNFAGPPGECGSAAVPGIPVWLSPRQRAELLRVTRPAVRAAYTEGLCRRRRTVGGSGCRGICSNRWRRRGWCGRRGAPSQSPDDAASGISAEILAGSIPPPARTTGSGWPPRRTCKSTGPCERDVRVPSSLRGSVSRPHLAFLSGAVRGRNGSAVQDRGFLHHVE
jgi:hypothetical protein